MSPRLFPLLVMAAIVALAGSVRAATLRDLVRSAVQTHPEVLGRMSEHEAREADVAAARWQRLPVPSVSSTQTRGGNVTSLRLQQTLWAGGQIDAAIDGANNSREAAQQAVFQAREELALRVVTAYGDWLRAQGRVAAARGAVAAHQRFAQLIARRVQSGISAQADRDLAAARLASIETDLATAEAGAQLALAQLSSLAGSPLGAADLEAVEVPQAQVTVSQADLEALVTGHSSVQRAEAEARALEAEMRRKRGQSLPTVFVRAERQIGQPPGMEAPRFMIGVEMTPGAGLSGFDTTNAAAHRYEAALAARDAALRRLRQQLEQELLEHRTASSRARQLEAALAASRNVLASYERQFVAGRKTWLEVLNAAREVSQLASSISDAQAGAVAAAQRLQIYLRGA
jgi:adhesin transport system outer membrane protein